MSNVLEAINNITKLSKLRIDDITKGNNRANNAGQGLENFVKDAFAGTFDISDKTKRIKRYSEVFSYEGSKNNPPDLMLKQSDAIEVKKQESISTDLQLNSSHPKSKLYSSSTLINEHCRKCEEWEQKDFLYTVGYIPRGEKNLKALWFIYGDLYAADEGTYISLKNQLTEKIKETPNIAFSQTKEIGRINAVDPLKITSLRIRGMWLLQSPFRVFDYLSSYRQEARFQVAVLLTQAKYDAQPEKSKRKIEANKKISITEVKHQNPNNPVALIDCVLITYKI